MYAIIADGSHQYRVEEGVVFDVQRKDLDEKAKKIEFDRVLMVGGLPDGPKIGAPMVEGAKVTALIVDEVKAEKLVIRKYTRRKGYTLKKGHRQKHLRLKVEKISA